MNLSIEKNLQQYKTHIIDHATLSTVLVSSSLDSYSLYVKSMTL